MIEGTFASLNIEVIYEVAIELIEGDLPNEKAYALREFFRALFNAIGVPRPALSFTEEKFLQNMYHSAGFLTFPINVGLEELLAGFIAHILHVGFNVDKKAIADTAKKHHITIETIEQAVKGNQKAKAAVFLFLNFLELKITSNGIKSWANVEKQRGDLISYIESYAKKDKRDAKFVEACLKRALSWHNPFETVTLAEWLKNGSGK
jgi:hypothetical protein